MKRQSYMILGISMFLLGIISLCFVRNILIAGALIVAGSIILITNICDRKK